MAVDAAHLQGCRQQVHTFLTEHGIEENAAYDVLLCVHEACANAVEHSNSARDVEITMRLSDGSLSVAVADAGRGLDAAYQTDHHRPAQLSPEGRGLYVMSCLMDELSVHIDGGTEIRMVKQLTEVDQELERAIPAR